MALAQIVSASGTASFTFRAFQHHPCRHTASQIMRGQSVHSKGAILLHSHARRLFRNHSHCPSIDGVLFITLHCIISRANTAPVVVWLGYTAPVRVLLPRHFDICCPSTKQIHHEIAILFGTRADRFGIRHCTIHVSRVSTPPLQTHCPIKSLRGQ